MRAGYLMHRFVHRLFGAELPPVSFPTDGAEMGKLLVAEGLGVTVLPDYSIEADTLVKAGAIVHRPLADDSTTVSLISVRRKDGHEPAQVRALQASLVGQART
jgi:DNA-binding transcriptional LysR family regulator